MGVAVLAGAALWWRYARGERDCARAEADARRLLQQDEPGAVLELIDGVDARFRCARYTAGDAPPIYSLAHAALQRLRERGEGAAADRLLARARGPLLCGIAGEAGR